MQFGMVGLGRMGGNMVRRLCRAGHPVAGWDRDTDTVTKLAEECGMDGAETPRQLVAMLSAPRVVWLMLPAGDVTARYVEELGGLLEPGDVLVDGGNAYYKDSMTRAAALAERGVAMVDAGVSGGVWGLENGYSLMVGGTEEAVGKVRPFLETLAPAADRGLIHCGPPGSGHFVKMVHNGVEYGLMQAYAEGFALMRSHEEFGLDLGAVAETWRHGSVVRSWLLDLTAEFLARDQTLENVEPYVADSGEGRWTVLDCVEQGVPAPVMTQALMARFDSQGGGSYAHRVLAMMREGFGGHAVKRK